MTVKNSNFSHLRATRIGLLLLVTCTNALAQDSLKTIDIESVHLISTDRQGNVYLGLADGAIDKYNIRGKLEGHFSPEKPSEATLIEAWNPLRIFVFYRDFQEYVFLDRFLTSENRFSLSEVSSYIGLATISLDNNLWLIDYSDFSLKKYNLNFEQVTIERPLDLVLDPDDYDIAFMREYQNLLFVLDRKKGILVFDNLGNYLREFNAKGLEYLSFSGNELYYIDNDTVKFKDIYSGNTRQTSLIENTSFLVLHKQGEILISDKKMWVFSKNR